MFITFFKKVFDWGHYIFYFMDHICCYLSIVSTSIVRFAFVFWYSLIEILWVVSQLCFRISNDYFPISKTLA